MGIEENKTIIRRLIETVSTLDLSNLVTSDFVCHTVDGMKIDMTGFQQRFMILRNAIPDLKQDIEDIVAEGDKVVARIRFYGTHQGKFINIEPSGNEISMKCYITCRFQNEKIAEEWMVQDYYSMFLQMGVVPAIWDLGK